MIDYPLDLVRELGVERPVVVVGHGAESVREHIGDGVDFAVQDKSTGWGTGHAVMSAQQFLEEGKVYVLAGDMPLLRWVMRWKTAQRARCSPLRRKTRRAMAA